MATKRILTPPKPKKKPRYAHPTRNDIFANSEMQKFMEENPAIPAGVPKRKNNVRWKKPQPTIKRATKKR
jgi:hypothetical protein